MTLKIQRGVIAGSAIALVVPISYLILALLVQTGITPGDLVRPFLDGLTTVALFEVVLAPVGIVTAGRSAGVRSAGAWFLLSIVALPGLAIVWFIGVTTLGGALGNPF